jgi:transposase
MIGRNSEQIDIFSHMIYDRLIAKDHLLVKISSIMDFSFVYDKVKDRYSTVGRASKDPVMMFKICLLEYLYNLSDVQIAKRICTDVAFRWFLGLNIDDEVPDDTTISHFRINRMNVDNFEFFFNEIVKLCIEKDIIKKRRYIIDTTDVAANVNYPSDRNLIRSAFRKVIKEIEKFNEPLAIEQMEQFKSSLDKEYKLNENVSVKKYLEIANKHIGCLYVKTYDALQTNEEYQEAFGILYDIVDQYTNNKKDKIISIVDTDARVAHKSVGNMKRGYKNHIIVDEDSEIIVSSSQTPFNIGDEKKLVELIEKVEKDFDIKPEEISADKVYGSNENRAYLKDNEIISNINFYNESSRELAVFGIKEFNISENLESATCPNGINTTEYILADGKGYNLDLKIFKFDKNICRSCPLREQCIRKNPKGKINGARRLEVPVRYDAVIHDLKRAESKEFQAALNSRFKVERRFATMVRNHGLRRSRYLNLSGAKVHITLANMVCNIVRMVSILYPPGIVALKN